MYVSCTACMYMYAYATVYVHVYVHRVQTNVSVGTNKPNIGPVTVRLSLYTRGLVEVCCKCLSALN